MKVFYTFVKYNFYYVGCVSAILKEPHEQQIS